MAIFFFKGARVNKGLTQKQAAELLDVSTTTLVSWEKGRTMPKVGKISALCELYGLGYDELDFLPNNPLKAD